MRTPKEWYKAGLRGEMKAKGVAQSPSGRPFVYGRVVVNFGGCEASAAPVHRSLREGGSRQAARAPEGKTTETNDTSEKEKGNLHCRECG